MHPCKNTTVPLYTNYENQNFIKALLIFSYFFQYLKCKNKSGIQGAAESWWVTRAVSLRGSSIKVSKC